MLNIDKLLEGLNEGQKKAVKHINGPALTIATAGAGKTRVIIARAQYMIASGIDPSQILLTTFTNKAANEMKERIVSIVGDRGKRITVGTFHSICNRILRKYGHYLNYERTFTILDEEETDKIMKKIAKRYNFELAIVKTYIGDCKLHCKLTNQAYKEAETDVEKQLAQCYSEYQSELKRNQCMDFDDLLLQTVVLLENYPEVKKTINNKWKYISADENQDSSQLDSKLIYLLSGKNNNVFFVGDDNQSIYGFRGADLEVMLNLRSLYPELKVYDLGINYRSTETIVEAGKSIIRNNRKQIEKSVKCGRGIKGSPVIITKCANQKDEANKIIAYVKMLHNKKGLKYSEIAILNRMSYLSRTIEEALMRAKIKYTLVGGTPFFCRMEVQDILAYARLTVNEHDFLAFKRTVSIPKRGIGDKTIDKIEEFAREFPGGAISIRKALDNPKLPVKGKAKTGIKEYNNFLKKLDKKKAELSPKDFINYIIKEIGYAKYLKENYKDTYQDKLLNLQELENVAEEYNSIDELIMEASLYREELDENEDAVQIMTIHKSKGLEFPAVIMTNMCEGTCPHYKSIDDPKQLEEERRLTFVGVTRAEDYLFMTYPQQQKIQGRTQFVRPSRFLNEIDQSLVYRN